jgi:hypothetical protein
MSLTSERPGFRCKSCGSPSIRVEGTLTASTPVRCGGCGRTLSTWASFVEDVHALLRTHGVALPERPPGAGTGPTDGDRPTDAVGAHP